MALSASLRGVLKAATLGIHAIGRAIAFLEGISPNSGKNRIDRLLSNDGIDLQILFPLWVPFVVGNRKQIVMTLDWTDFDHDDHTTLFACIVTEHGRATPLCWKTVQKSQLAGQRSKLEQKMVEELHSYLDESIDIILLCDRGFGSQQFYDFLSVLGWDYVIRFRGNILVENQEGVTKAAAQWLGARGHAVMLKGAKVTGERTEVPAVVVLQEKEMKQVWCLATSLSEKTAREVTKLYGKLFTTEETFRDQKNLNFGLGLSAVHIKDASRRDRMLLLVAMAEILLTLLGAASEASGMDKKLGSDHTKKRTVSLFKQGLYWYELLPTMREEWLKALMKAFDRILTKISFFREAFGLV
jgi:hypothetical protein